MANPGRAIKIMSLSGITSSGLSVIMFNFAGYSFAFQIYRLKVMGPHRRPTRQDVNLKFGIISNNACRDMSLRATSADTYSCFHVRVFS